MNKYFKDEKYFKGIINTLLIIRLLFFYCYRPLAPHHNRHNRLSISVQSCPSCCCCCCSLCKIWNEMLKLKATAFFPSLQKLKFILSRYPFNIFEYWFPPPSCIVIIDREWERPNYLLEKKPNLEKREREWSYPVELVEFIHHLIK